MWFINLTINSRCGTTDLLQFKMIGGHLFSDNAVEIENDLIFLYT